MPPNPPPEMPATARSRRVYLFLRCVYAGMEPIEVRRKHPDLWPPGVAGDGRWTRDRRAALALRIENLEDRAAARRVRLRAWLEAHPGATLGEIGRALAYKRASNGKWPTVRYDLGVIGVAWAGFPRRYTVSAEPIPGVLPLPRAPKPPAN